MTEELKACPFCGGEPLIQEHPAHSHSLQIGEWKMPDHPGSWTIECVKCNCGMIDESCDAALRAWNTRAQLPSQGGEAVAEYQQLSRYGNWERIDKVDFDLGMLGNCPEKFRALYTHPADQVEDDLTTVKVSRELLEQIAVELEHDNDRYFLGRELRAILEAKDE